MFNPFKRNKYQDTTIIPQYEPPEDITAPELGVLFDGKAGRLEFAAAIYQLKVRKIISLDKHETDDVTATLLTYQPETLNAYEDLLVRFLFHESHEVALQKVFTGEDYIIAQTYFQYLVLQSLGNKNLIILDSKLYDLTYDKYLLTIYTNPLLFAKEVYEGMHPRKYTPQAEALMPTLLGFKQYIETAELDKIKFHARGDLQAYIEKLTPYAVAFNQMKRWELLDVPLFVVGEREPVKFFPQAEAMPEDIPMELVEIVKKFDTYRVS